jgi:DNA-directed RNA polymerase subunit beta
LRLEIPIYSYQEIIRLGGSFSSRVILPRTFYDHKNSKIYFKWIVLGSLPILTRQGHFLVNGLVRVCIIQIVRGAGIYINKKVDTEGRIYFYLDIVPERGSWVRLEKDNIGQVWIRMRKEPRLPMWSILQTIGLLSFSSYFFSIPSQKRKKIITETIIDKTLINKKSFSDSLFFGTKGKIKNARCFEKGNSLIVSKLFQRQKAKLIYIVRKFSRIWAYDLGVIGRKRLNQRFHQFLPTSFRCLVPTDFLSALKELNNVSGGKISVRNFDDVDSLRVRRVRAVGDFLQREVRQAILRLEKRANQSLDSFSQDQRYRFIQSFTNQPFDQIFHRFVIIYPLLQFADQLNPLSDLTQKRRLTGLGPGGLNLSNRKIDVRTIHPSHFGCLCPVETPEGQNAGIVNSPTLIRRLSEDSRLQVLVTVRQTGWMQINLTNAIIKQEISLWVSKKIGDWTVRFAYGLLSDALGKIKLREFLKFIDVDTRDFSSISRDQVELVCTGNEQRLALGPNIIPFLEHDDGNRVLMGANILRQALPVVKVSVPRVASELYIYAGNDSGQNLRSRWSGFVSYVSIQRILVQSQIDKNSVVLHHQAIQGAQKKNRENIIFRFFVFKSQAYACCVEYRLGGVFRSNQSTWRYHKPYVKEGDWVLKGDLLADGRASLCGNLAVGQNLLVCYMPWDGLNFEDAIVGSERLQIQETFTSIHIEEWESILKQTPNGVELFVPFSRELFWQAQGSKYGFSSLNYSSNTILIDARKKKKFHLMFKKKNYISKKDIRKIKIVLAITRFIKYKSNFLVYIKKVFNFSKYSNKMKYFIANTNFFNNSQIDDKKARNFFFPRLRVFGLSWNS